MNPDLGARAAAMLPRMKSALCLLVSAAEAQALGPTLRGLGRSGTRIQVAAPPAAVAAAGALGVSVDHVIGEAHPASLEGLFERLAPELLLLVAAGGDLHASATTAAAQAGIPVALLSLDASSPGGAAPGLALEDFVAGAKREIAEIPPEAALEILEMPNQNGWHFVDVREPDEYAAGHLPGARSSPRGFLEVRADLVHYKRDPWFEDRDRPMILYCGGGHRSALATQTLRRMGFTRILSLAEGFTGWTERRYPVSDPEA